MASSDRGILNRDGGHSGGDGRYARTVRGVFAMQIKFTRHFAFLVTVMLVIAVCLVDAGAQRRKRRSRVTNAATASPSPTPDETTDPADPKIVSTADQTTSNTTSRTNSNQRPKPANPTTTESDSETLRRTITDLSGQLNKLNDKLNQVEEQQRSLVDIERLNRAEQRGEGFRAQLRDVQQKETDIQGQLDQLEYALQPDNIERAVGMMGTTRPEEVREQRRRQLEGQRTKVKAQYDQLEQSRVRLEAAIATADQEVDTLRAKIDAANVEANQPPAPKTTVQPARAPTYTPTPPSQEPLF
jgi:predicted  nucleic acid-binding Zn-ribbon protein